MFTKKIGLALGGGAAKGLAHIGVLKVLEEHGIKVDLVSGTSIGSIVGALHCAGYSAKQIQEIAESTKWPLLIDVGLPNKGLVKGNKIEKFLREKLENKSFKDLQKPLYITAADIEKDQEVIFNKGDVTSAVRASISIPGIFNAVSINDRVLVDGGLLDPLPVKILKEEGVDIIIAVNLHPVQEQEPILESAENINQTSTPNIAKVIARSMQIIQANETRKTLKTTEADLIITPNLKQIGYQDFHKSKQAIRLGEIAANKEILKIKKLQKGSFWDFLKK